MNLVQSDLLLVLAMIAATSTLGACGGTDSSNSGTGSSISPTTPTTPSGTTSTVSIKCPTSDSGITNTNPAQNGTAINQPYIYSWTCSTTSRVLSANGIPNHSVTGGSFATAVSVQSISATYPLTPSLTNLTSTAVMPSGHALNGIKFDPGTAGTCTNEGICNPTGNGGAWHMEALSPSSSFSFGTDSSNGHVQPNGAYHYHGVPLGLVSNLGGGTNIITLVGWAPDGFPIYSLYGYSTPTDAKSAIRLMTSSYQLKSTPNSGRPSTTVYAMGAFTEDWNYVAGSGDLDECNGRFDVTPEFPQGIYHYYVTQSYPYVHRCVKGTAATSTPPRP
jgi:hypothetical protein